MATTYSSAIGCFVIGNSPIGTGGPCPPSPAYPFNTIPSYLYWQYRDDDNLQAFVDAYNQISQQFVDWFGALNLPVYTSDPVSGELLDWVGTNLYGMPRPILSAGSAQVIGPLNTFYLNERLGLNGRRTLSNFTSAPASDDLYRRVLTWHFFKGDGKTFSIRWLKRRIMRFLEGENGQDPGVNQTYRVSVVFSGCCQIDITLVTRRSALLGGAILNRFRPGGGPSAVLNSLQIAVISTGPQFSLADTFKTVVDQSILELPFQYNVVVTVQ